MWQYMDMENNIAATTPATNEYDRYMDRSDFELSFEEQWAYANALNDIRQSQEEKDDERY